MEVHVPDLDRLTPAAGRILDAASALFCECGVHAVGVDTIAEAAGVTKKTLYDRFGSKESLVVAYLRLRELRWRTILGQHLEMVPAPGIDRVLSVFDAAALYRANGSKGCSAVNARAETVPEAGCPEPAATGRTLAPLLEGVLVTLGMRAFAEPMEQARTAAHGILTGALQQANTAAP